MRILTFSTLYPSSARPTHGVFVETRIRHLVASGEVTARVVAPVPWFPSRDPRFGSYADLARTPREEDRFGIPVVHPRYVAIPKVGMTASPALLYAGSLAAVRRLLESGYDFGLIDAHYFYPDGVAAAMLARTLGKPVVITARGTDINLIPRHALPRRMILWAARQASAVIAVCQALKDRLVELGVPAAKVAVLRNGVDLDLFRPLDRAAARARLGVDEPMILSVGHLIPRKGHDVVLRALAQMTGPRLFIVGTGPEDRALRALVSGGGDADAPRARARVITSSRSASNCASSRWQWESTRNGFNYLSLAPLGTSSLKVTRTGRPSSPTEAATIMPFDSTPRSLRGCRLVTSTTFMPTSCSGW